MRTTLLVIPALLVSLGCDPETATSPKVRQQKAIFRSAGEGWTRDAYKKLDRDIAKTMKEQGLATEGQALLFLMDRGITFYATAMAGLDERMDKDLQARGITRDPLEVAESQIKRARDMRKWTASRDAIAHLETTP